MTDLILYHNPRCSKSRGALELLQARGMEPTIVRYLDTPPSEAEPACASGQARFSARQLLRTGEEEYQSLGLADTALTDAQIIAAMARHPRLIERPILIAGDKAVIGRPPERVLELLA